MGKEDQKMKKPKREKLPEFAISGTVLEQFGSLLEEASRNLVKFERETLKPLGLTGKHLEILLVLEQKALNRQKGIGRLGIDRNTLATLMNGLEKVGMVERPKNAAGRRSDRVLLTTEGRGILSQRMSPKSQIKILSGLTPEEQKTLIRLLRKLILARFNDLKI
jgi:DNA-binding MarR family transcriptional regulator